MENFLKLQTPLLGGRKRYVYALLFSMLLLVTNNSYGRFFYQSEKFSIVLKNVAVKDVLNEIKSKSDYDVIYKSEHLNDLPKVSINVENASVESVLDKCLNKTEIGYIIDEKIIVLKKKKEIKKEVIQQQQKIKVKGKVIDASGETLPGVSVMEKGTDNGVVTDENGNYEITVSSASSVLIYSFVGMNTQEQSVAGRANVDIQLISALSALDEVVVVGYGVQKKSDVTGSVSTINTERMENKPNVNFTQALQGAMSGVYMTTTSSSAEEGNVELLLRGRNSINASNSPLIVLDGVPFSGNFSEINTVDIESINVLKDASSVAIYGSRGSNGVILITTKKGKSGAPRISYNGYYGLTVLDEMLDVYEAHDYIEWKKERFGVKDLSASEKRVLDSGKFMDWRDEVFQNGVKQEHNISVSGANDNNKYYVSATSFESEGIAVNDKFKRYSLRVNLEQKINKWITIGTNNQMTYSNRDGIPANIGRAYTMNPLTEKYDEDRNLTIYPWESDPYFENPLEPTLAVNEDDAYKIITNNFVNVKIPYVKGLTYKLNTGAEIGFREVNTYWGRDTKTGTDANGKSETKNSNTKNFLVENILSYVRDFGKHSVNFTGLYSYQKEVWKSHNLEANTYPDDAMTYYKPILAGLISPTVGYSSEVLLSQMGRLNYGYDNKYMATLTVRRDGFTGFGENVKYGIFPSVALGWNIHNENFFKNDYVNSLKLRASYGENGNQAIGPYDNLAKLLSDDKVNYINGSTTLPGFVPESLANDDLSWETTTTANIGIDFGILNGRIQGSLDVYKSHTKDLLFWRSIPSVHGVKSILQNIGETENRGVEVSLNAHVLEYEGFKWNAGFNFSANKNEIVSLYGAKEDDVANGFFIGQPIRVNYGYVFDGIWQEGDDFANSAQPDAVPGDIKVKDVTNEGDDKDITSIDREIQGQLDPKWTWGMENTFSYKNLSLYVFMHGVNGITKRNSAKLNDDSFDGRKNTNIKNYWTPENPINTYPRNHQHANLKKVMMYESADFIRIKDITLSYQLEKSLLEKLRIQNLKIYFTARNMFTISDWDGMDPELNSQLSIPLQKEYIFGLNFTF